MSDPTGGWAAATTEGLKALRELGGAIAEPIREVTGMATDHLRVIRFERQLRLADRARTMMRERGIERLDRHIPLNTLLPLLDHASLEEDDDLQDVWARMLVNAGNSNQMVQMRSAYVSMLQGMTAFDVRILSLLNAARPPTSPGGIVTSWLPHKAMVSADEPMSLHPPANGPIPAVPGDPTPVTTAPEMSHEVAVSLGNLRRLGCLDFTQTADGGYTEEIVSLTVLGRAFVRACQP